MLGIDRIDVEANYRALAPYAKFSVDNLENSLQVTCNFRAVKNVSELVNLLR